MVCECGHLGTPSAGADNTMVSWRLTIIVAYVLTLGSRLLIGIRMCTYMHIVQSRVTPWPMHADTRAARPRGAPSAAASRRGIYCSILFVHAQDESQVPRPDARRQRNILAELGILSSQSASSRHRKFKQFDYVCTLVLQHESTDRTQFFARTPTPPGRGVEHR